MSKDIPIRALKFTLDEPLPCYWYQNNPTLTHAFNAGLLMFPLGEQFFIEVVASFRKQITDEKLLEDIKAFTSQEAHHSRAHQSHNDRLREQGYDMDAIEAKLKRRLDKIIRVVPKKHRLAIVVAYEHFTAMFTNAVLNDPRWLANLPPTYQDFLIWHAIEELEHKSVAFRVYQQVGGSYSTRAIVMMGSFFVFYKSIINYLCYFMKADGISTWTTTKALLKFMFKSPGSFYQLAPAHIKYFSPWFDPDHEDSKPLINAWRQTHEPRVLRDYALHS